MEEIKNYINNPLKLCTMIKQFKIYKLGVTDSKITILSKIGERFNRDEKIKKYIFLGYEIYDLNDIKISV